MVEVHHIGRVPHATISARLALQFVYVILTVLATLTVDLQDALHVQFAVSSIPEPLIFAVVFPPGFGVFPGHLPFSS
jgi:hypothetical protein